MTKYQIFRARDSRWGPGKNHLGKFVVDRIWGRTWTALCAPEGRLYRGYKLGPVRIRDIPLRITCDRCVRKAGLKPLGRRNQMPKTVNREEDEYPLPAETPFYGRLESVAERVIEYTLKKDSPRKGKQKGDKDSFTVWTWTFKIVDGEYGGMEATGDTDDRMTTREDNLVRLWAEALMGRSFEVGEGLNTDDLIGLPCWFTVRHEEPRERRDGRGKFYPCVVDQVFPADAFQRADEVPF